MGKSVHAIRIRPERAKNNRTCSFKNAKDTLVVKVSSVD